MNNKSGELPTKLDFILNAISEKCPVQAISARHFLVLLCLPWLKQENMGIPMEKSLLTPGGYPIEFAFRTNRNNIGYTAEPGLPMWTVKEKQNFIKEITGKFDFKLFPLFQELTDQSSQHFGCWLSVRHHEDVPDFKIYQEILAQKSDLVLKQMRDDIPDFNNENILEPKLLGIVLGNGGVREYYCKINDPDPGVLHKLFTLAGAAKQLPCVINYLSYLASEERDKLWRRLRLGVSIKISSSGIPKLTLFAHSIQLFSDNLQARQRILGLVRQIGKEMPLYDHVTIGFEENDTQEMAHNLIGINIADSGLDFAVGLQPFSL